MAACLWAAVDCRIWVRRNHHWCCHLRLLGAPLLPDPPCAPNLLDAAVLRFRLPRYIDSRALFCLLRSRGFSSLRSIYEFFRLPRYIDSRASYGTAPLHLAAHQGHLAAVQRLIHHGASLTGEPLAVDQDRP